MDENNANASEQAPEPDGSGPQDTAAADPVSSEPSQEFVSISDAPTDTPTEAATEPGPATGAASSQAGPSAGATPPPPPPPPPPHSEPLLSRLRRSKSDEMIGGVCGGLGVATGIDPLIFRVVFVVTGFLGGAGLIMYLAAWALIPEEGHNIGGFGKEFNVKDDVQVRTIGMIVAAVFAVMSALGSGPWMFGSWSNGSIWVIATIAVTAGLIYWIIAASKGQTMSSHYYTESSATDWTGGTSTATSAAGAPTPPAGGSYTGSTTPPPPPPAPKPAEPGSLMLFGLTVSIGAIAIGALAMWASVTEPLDLRVYVAVALAVTALGTLIGMRWGKPGGLITLGSVLSVVLVLSSLVPNVSMGAINMSPTSVREIREPITLGMGEIEIDLREISPESSLHGLTLDVTNGMGRVEIIVPEDLDVEVNAAVRLGQISVLGLDRTGSAFSLGKANELTHEADGLNPLVINATTNIGEVQVTRK